MNSDANGLGLRVRALDAAQCQAVAAALLNGVAASDLAAEFGVSRRTIYRAAEYARMQWERVDVGDYTAQFVLPKDGPPIRCTPWYQR